MELTTYGNGGSVAIVASCLTGVNRVPLHADTIHYIEGPTATASAAATPNQVAIRKEDAKSFMVTGSLDQNRAFLLSCATGDVTTSNPIVQLDAISGTFSDSSDVLAITALDSETRMTFTGADRVLARSFTRTDDITTFAASSQYYMTWSSNSTSSSSSSEPITISYSCVETAWFNSGIGLLAPSGAAPLSAAVMLQMITAVVVLLAA
jgi:hypothetical protein